MKSRGYQMNTQIIAIGGGMFKNRDSDRIEEYILKQTGKPRPNICFLATATGDNNQEIVRFYEVFSNFSCERTHLSLFSVPKDIESFILKQDVIYVGGGNTKNLLLLWEGWGLDKILHNAWQNGVILAGSSAGSICWFEEGLSDYIPTELNPIKALGFIKGSNCPHYDDELKRKPHYCELISNGIMKEGIAADSEVALHYIGGKLEHIVSAKSDGKAYQIKRSNGGFQEIELKPDIYL